MRFLALLVFCSFSLWAQTAGRITGTVSDSTGAVMPGADVRLTLPRSDKPVMETKTTTEGLFHLPGVAPGTYDLKVEAAGFNSQLLRDVKVDPARETVLPAITLTVATVTASVDVSAAAPAVETTNSEVSTTVTNAQVRRLPLLDRNPLDLIRTQAGVVANGRSETVINGQRTSYSNMSLDGINIQDNFIRDNSLDYTPNLPFLDQVGEFTVASSNANSAFGGGSAQVVIVTPSGKNEFFGSAYWYNRNNFFSANEWFNNRDGVERPFLNQNQAGVTLGGPIKKDKLLFYTNYEAYRQRQQTPVNRVILTADARQGIYTYRDNQGNVRKVNVLTATGLQMDPYVRQILSLLPGPENINNTDEGDSTPTLLRNTAGYRFNKRSNWTRDNVLFKADYMLSTRHTIAATYAWNRDDSDRPDDMDNDFSKIPKVTNANRGNLLSTAWRWSPSATLTNEVRFGFNRAPGDFLSSEQFGNFIVDGFVFSNPVNTFRSQGRATNTYNFANNASYVRGRHNVQFGFQFQGVRTKEYDELGTIPTYYIGIGTGNQGLRESQLPGIRSADLTAADDFLASLAGYITSYSQTFNITSRSSGFVPGAPYRRRYKLNDWAWYVQDNWKLRPRVTLNLGLRYTLSGPADELDSLLLQPLVEGGDVRRALLSNSTLDFAGSSAGRPLYRRDRNNFAPNVGLAWDLFGDGKTAFRAGYSISHVNDQSLYAPVVIAWFNEGLQAAAEDTGLTGRISTGLPKITVPTYKVPRKFADNYEINPQTAYGLVDPKLRTPYVQQWSVGIQRNLKLLTLEARYVGNHSVKGYRAFDLNQVIIRENGFLDDFLRARNNGFLARQATGTFNPAYNANIPGSQPLTVFPRLVRGGQLTNSAIRNLILRGEVGELAARYQIDGLNGPINFFQNVYGLGSDLLTNFSHSTYNSLQVEARRRAGSDLDFQVNYTFSKVLSDSAGNYSAARLEHFLDLANGRIERARADFDLTHAIKGNAIYDVPLLKKNRWMGGWAVSTIMIWQSGTPFSVLSQRGTLNRSSGYRSWNNTANTNLTKGQLDSLLGFRMTGDGPYFFPASMIGPDGRGVGQDGAAPFSGQAFFHPDPGTVGGLQRRMFSGPWTFNMDLGILKTTKLTEKKSLEFRMEATNIFNHASFLVGDQVISSADFGRITDTFSYSRRIQFGLYFKF